MTTSNAPAPAAQTPAADLPRLLQVAKNQRGIMLCILVNLVIVGVSALLPDIASGILMLVPTLLVGIASLWFTLRLAYAVVGGIGAGICALIIAATVVWAAVADAIGARLLVLVVLAVVNGRATRALKKAGFRVGLLGGSPSDVEARMRT
jgi:hypothetical protein